MDDNLITKLNALYVKNDPERSQADSYDINELVNKTGQLTVDVTYCQALDIAMKEDIRPWVDQLLEENEILRYIDREKGSFKLVKQNRFYNRWQILVTEKPHLAMFTPHLKRFFEKDRTRTEWIN